MVYSKNYCCGEGSSLIGVESNSRKTRAVYTARSRTCIVHGSIDVKLLVCIDMTSI